MKRTGIILLVVMCLSITTSSLWAWPWGGGKDGDSNATGQITKLTVRNPFAIVEGATSKGKLWLAYTVKWADGTEKDYTPQKVTGKFTERLTFQARPQSLGEVTVCLWRYKVSKNRCAKDNGKACEYCGKNGFHMEGRVARQTGS
jgi:hypothetical protein